MRKLRLLLVLALTIPLFSELAAQESPLNAGTFRGLALREIGPALTSGRIADFAVNHEDPSTYYVATASGGVWRTENAGTTFDPIFEGERSYSIGVVEVDPTNPHVVWVGTGENNGQRALGYGDGVYKSADGGNSWANMGLRESEHIGKILIHPKNGDIVYVAAQGPVWSSGGDRGLYKTTDGGENWTKILDISENTGVNEVHMDPRNPDILYASTWQRRRHVWTWISGGPESALYKSSDGGESWNKITNGIPGGDIGRVGLCVSPVDPDYVYAMVEGAAGRGGFFRSINRGGSFQRMSSYHTSGNYYSEIFCDLFDRDRVVSMDVWAQVTDDGGTTWGRFGERHKHVDNHAHWQDPSDPDHYLNGNDGGVYESWDRARTWQYKANLPITQFYKVALDNDTPFYNVYGGTQDNFSLGGPSRTTSQHGIVNSDWDITNGGDGFESQVDPTNPDIVYAESQYGGLVRYDRASGEIVSIKPQSGPGEPALRWNWDAPLQISPHSNTRIYHAANILFRSEDRGSSWRAVSPDLSRQLDRNVWEVMGQVWSMDAIAKNASTTIYGNIVAFDESTVQEDLLFVGTDDGLIQVTEDGGGNWQSHATFPGVPERTYVNIVLASRHDVNTVYAGFNNHKNGDFTPYLLRSTDKGENWQSIASNLPDRGSVYSIAEDPEVADLLFVGTEFGLYFTRNGGESWIELAGGLPTVAVRDLAIHPRENDLVLATFGRGFWVLDDYTPLRTATAEQLEAEAHIFPVRDALIYVPSRRLGLSDKSFQGESYFTAPNPSFGAIITYYMKEGIETLRDQRQEKESELREAGEPIPYPTPEDLRAEDQEEAPYLLFTIRNSGGDVVRRIRRAASGGMHRFAWDLRYPPFSPVDLSGPGLPNAFADEDVGPWAVPGTYHVSLSRVVDGVPEQIVDGVDFQVLPLNNATLAVEDKEALLAFQTEAGEVQHRIMSDGLRLGEASNRLRHIKEAIRTATTVPEGALSDARDLERRITTIRIPLNGDGSVGRRQFETTPSIMARIGNAVGSSLNATQAPSLSQRDQLRAAIAMFREIEPEIAAILRDLETLEASLERSGTPFTPGRRRGRR